MAEQFETLLSKSGLKKKDLADNLGVRPATVTAWCVAVPQYVIAYLEVLVALQKLQEENQALLRVVRMGKEEVKQ